MQELLAESEGVHLKIEEIDLEDKETLALFAAGNTKGIFQFEQSGAIRLLKRVKPQVFEEWWQQHPLTDQVLVIISIILWLASMAKKK